MNSERLRNTQIGLEDFSGSLAPSPVIEREKSKEPLYKTLSAPISSQVEITEDCNLSCAHCYNVWHQKPPSEYSTLNKDRLLYVLEELRNSGVFKVTLTGGEPLLSKDSVIEAVQYLTENNITCSINTNLTTVSEEDAFRLKEAGVQAILTSLMSFNEETHDGITQRRGSFQKTVRGIQNVLAAGISLVVHMPIARANEEQVYQTGKFVANLGVKAFAATKVSPTPGNPNFSEIGISRRSAQQSLETLFELQEQFGLQTDILECYPLCLIGNAQKFAKFVRRNCSAGVTTTAIGANGEVRPCIHSDEVSGNLFQEGLEESWERMNHWRDGSLIPKNCRECQYLQKCTAGCRVEAQYFGNIAGMDPYATSEADVLIPPEEKPVVIPEGFFEERLEFNPHLKMRTEDFGGIVDGKSGSYVFLNRDSYELMQRLKKEKMPFSVAQISQDYDVKPKEALKFFAHLYNNNVVTFYQNAEG